MYAIGIHFLKRRPHYEEWELWKGQCCDEEFSEEGVFRTSSEVLDKIADLTQTFVKENKEELYYFAVYLGNGDA